MGLSVREHWKVEVLSRPGWAHDCPFHTSLASTCKYRTQEPATKEDSGHEGHSLRPGQEEKQDSSEQIRVLTQREHRALSFYFFKK